MIATVSALPELEALTALPVKVIERKTFVKSAWVAPIDALTEAVNGVPTPVLPDNSKEDKSTEFPGVNESAFVVSLKDNDTTAAAAPNSNWFEVSFHFKICPDVGIASLDSFTKLWTFAPPMFCNF